MAENLKKHFSKEDMLIATGNESMLNISNLQRNTIFKRERDITSHLSEWLLSE